MNINQQLLKEAECDVKNSTTHRDLQNFSYPTQPYSAIQTLKGEHELFVFPPTKNNTTSSPGFFGQRFNATGCTFDIILTSSVY